uniref:Glycosyltransferase n=1 Tax=viral metagenome TaxID=1070528 RepID=A0A6C0DC26_9ZZZZ
MLFMIINNKNNNILPNNYFFNPLTSYNNLLEYINLINKNNKLTEFDNKIPIYLKPRNHIPVANYYEVIKNAYDYSDYHFVLYWINFDEATVIIRRLDDYKIDKQFELKVYDINKSDYETIYFKPVNSNEIITNIKFKIQLEKVEINNLQKIPKIIIQTAKSSECNLASYNAVMTFIDLNPEYEYMFFDDAACYNFIETNFDKTVIDAYNKLKPTAYRADLFRYCVLYKSGGCYFDIKQINRVPIRDIINKNSDLILCRDLKPNAFYNAIMLCTPNNKDISNLIDAVIKNVDNNYYGTCPLCPTGPCLCYNIIPHHKTDLVNRFDIIFYSHYRARHKGNIYSEKLKKIICNTAYKGYYKKNLNNYHKEWMNSQVYK